METVVAAETEPLPQQLTVEEQLLAVEESILEYQLTEKKTPE